MFEDGAKIDDILDVLKRPPFTGNKDKQRISETGLRYDAKQTPGDDVIKFEFVGQKTLEVST